MKRTWKRKEELHSPTLSSILMVEKAINKHKELGKYQLWRKLPKKMMYQTFQLIIKYLENSGKINLVGSRISLIKKETSEEKEKKPEKKEIPGYVT